jgi:SAM-dependent methyltransferase
MSKYEDQYKQMHENLDMFKGKSLIKHAETIGKLVNALGAESILDYGCGKGHQYHKDKLHEVYFNGIIPELYDIGVPEYSTIPEDKFDAVICTDVMEHIPEEELDEVIKQIYSKANKFVYFGICTRLAEKTLPNGENAHCTVKPLEWWQAKINPLSTVYTHINTYK